MYQSATVPTNTSSPQPPGPAAPRLRGRSLVLARAVWLALAALTLVVFVASLPALFTGLQTICRAAACPAWQLTPDEARALQRFGDTFSGFAAGQVLGSAVIELVSFAVGAVVFWRRSDERIALLVALFLIMFACDLNNNLEALAALQPAWTLPVRLVNLVAGFSWFVLYLFPDGRFVPRWTRWFVLWSALLSIPVNLFPGSALDVKAQFGDLYSLYLAVGGFFIVGVQIYRYVRVSRPVQRQQTKWVVFGIAIAILVGGTFGIVDPAAINQAAPTSIVDFVIGFASALAILLIPLSIGIAILRYRLWDVDTLINRALVYGLLTALLGALYAGLIIGLESLAGAITGATNQPIALVISTLAIAVLFLPVRRRIQALIDSRFYRRKYDAEKTLAAFSATLRNEVNLEQIRAQVLAVVQETMQPTHVSLWLRQPERHPGDLAHRLEPHDQVPISPDYG